MMRTPNAYAIACAKPTHDRYNTAGAFQMERQARHSQTSHRCARRRAAASMGTRHQGIELLGQCRIRESEAMQEPKPESLVPCGRQLSKAKVIFAGLTGAVPGLFPVPTQSRAKDEMKKGGTAAAPARLLSRCFSNVAAL